MKKIDWLGVWLFLLAGSAVVLTIEISVLIIKELVK